VELYARQNYVKKSSTLTNIFTACLDGGVCCLPISKELVRWLILQVLFLCLPFLLFLMINAENITRITSERQKHELLARRV
jgi:hypothetical protein